MGLLRENRGRGLRVVSITAADEEEVFLDVGRERGLEHSVASAGWYGEDSPYLNLNETAGRPTPS